MGDVLEAASRARFDVVGEITRSTAADALILLTEDEEEEGESPDLARGDRERPTIENV